MPQKIINIPTEINSSHNGHFVDIYSPSMIGEHQLDGLILDFFITIELPSITPLPDIVAPEGSGLMTKEELERYFAESTSNSPSKTLALYYEKNGVTIPGRKLLCYSRLPSYTIEMLQFLTTKGQLPMAYGTKLKAKIEDFNSGLLGQGDKLSVWIIAEDYKILDTDFLIERYVENA